MSTDLATLVQTRLALQAIAEHVMSAARHRATGRIGLRVSAGGFATPPFPSSAGLRTLSVVGTDFLVADDDGVRREPISTLAAAAALAGIEPGAPTEVYTPTTALEPGEPLPIDPRAAAALSDWFTLADSALSTLRGDLVPLDPTEIQLWPEHFDLGFQAAEVNWGASPGDAAIAQPYLYVGPWTPPGVDGAYWNADFGSYRAMDEIHTLEDAHNYYQQGRQNLGL